MEDSVKMRTFLKEFPFLRRIIEMVERRRWSNLWIPIHITSAYVQRADISLLHQTPSKADGKYYFVATKEGAFSEVGGQDRKWLPFLWKVDEKRSIGEALVSFNEIMEAYYIVEVNACSLTLYKPPKTFTLAEWIAEQKRRAEEELKQKLAEIDDAEAEKQ